METTEAPEVALKYYDDLLEADPANSVRAYAFLALTPPLLFVRIA